MTNHFRAMSIALAASFSLIAAAPAVAQSAQDAPPAVTQVSPTAVTQKAPMAEERFAVRGQVTFVVQGTPGFASPYQGGNSLTPNQVKETFDATLYAGVRPWRGAEAWINPEVDQGFGLSNTLGVAGFPSAEAYKVGKTVPYVRLQRLFFRQTIGLGGGSEAVSGSFNQLAGARDLNRLLKKGLAAAS